MVFFSVVEFDLPGRTTAPPSRGAVPYFEQFDLKSTHLEVILETFTRYLHHNTTAAETECIRKLPEKIKLLAEDAANKEGVEKIAKTFGETPFVKDIVNKLILSLTPSPHPPSPQERLIIVSWMHFCEIFPAQLPDPITHSLKGIHHLLSKLHTKDEIERDPYLERISAMAARFLKLPIPSPHVVKYPDQLKFINDFSAWFMKCYLLEPLCEDLFPPTAIEEIANLFKQYFSQISERLFQHDPRPVLPIEKTLTINLMKSVNRFLERLNTTLEKQPVIISPDFTQQFYQNSVGAEVVYDRKKLLYSMYGKLKRLLSSVTMPKGEFQQPADKILILLLTTALMNLFKRLSNPEVVPFIIEQLIDRGIPRLEETSTQKKVSDPKFEQDAGNELSLLCKQFLNLGSKTTLISIATKGLTVWLGTIKKKMGSYVHEKMHGLASRELLLLEPFRFASTFLFQESGETQAPIFRRHLNQSTQNKQSYCARTKQRFFDNLYPSLMGWIELMHASGANIIKGEATKIYCNTMGEKLWDLSQNSDLMLMLMDEILSGLEESITNGSE